MKCMMCGCEIDGEPQRIFMENFSREQRFIKDIIACPDGANEDSNCTSEMVMLLRKIISKECSK